MIVGVVYRPPGCDANLFNEMLESALIKVNKEDKNCIIADDFNLDLLLYDEHEPTNNFVNNMMSYSFIPTINNPTRLTDVSATLIDNIFSNFINYNYR